MQHKFKHFVSMLLLVVTVLTGTTLTNHSAYAAVSPQEVNDAIDKFVGAIGKFAAKD